MSAPAHILQFDADTPLENKFTHVCALTNDLVVVGGFSYEEEGQYVALFKQDDDSFVYQHKFDVCDAQIVSIVRSSDTQFAVLFVNGYVTMVSMLPHMNKIRDLSPLNEGSLAVDTFCLSSFNDGTYLRLNNTEFSLFSTEGQLSENSFGNASLNIQGCTTVYNTFVDHVFMFYEQNSNKVFIATADINNKIVQKGQPLVVMSKNNVAYLPSDFQCCSHLFDNLYIFVFANVVYIIESVYNSGQYAMRIVCCALFAHARHVMKVAGLPGHEIIMLCKDVASQRTYFSHMFYFAELHEIRNETSTIYDSVTDMSVIGGNVFAAIQVEDMYVIRKFLLLGQVLSQHSTPARTTHMEVMLT